MGKRRGKRPAVRLRPLSSQWTLTPGPITWFQLAAGMLPFERNEAIAAAGIRADLERRGLPIGPLDNLIAGTAKAHQAMLVTHNVSELSRIPGLTMVVWYA